MIRNSLTVIYFVLYVLLSSAAAADQEQQATSIQAAVDRYVSALQLTDRNEQLSAFKQSQQLFRQVLESNAANEKQSSKELWVAFANASLQSEQIGWAILGYRRALSLDPLNSQATQNLKFARTLVSSWQSPPMESQLGDTLFFWRSSYTRSGQHLFAACLFFGAGLTATLGIAFSRRWVLIVSGLLVAMWGIFCIPIALDLYQPPQRWGVVVADEAILRTADTPGAPQRLNTPIPAGAELKILTLRDDWLEVEIPSGSGWLRSQELRTVDVPFAQRD